MAKVRITQIKSGIGRTQRQRGTLRALGLKRINDAVVQENTADIAGMIRTVSHLVRVEDAVDK